MKTGSMRVVCDQCGLVYFRPPSRVVRFRHHFCSGTCSEKWHSGDRHHSSHRILKRQCKTCGKDISVRMSVAEKGSGKFCSKKCYDEWKKTITGEMSPKWKGGISRATKLLRTSSRYMEWRKKVLDRDVGVCIKCAKSEPRMHVHHVKKFADILHDLGGNVSADKLRVMASSNPSLWDVSNGMTMCCSCHRKEHAERSNHG